MGLHWRVPAELLKRMLSIEVLKRLNSTGAICTIPMSGLFGEKAVQGERNIQRPP
ncbi:hypothetical protein KPK_B0064 (plasmid) [Klebsiella variicola]|uniref:Uncharacterized protein n=1 Tax=Klebsiella variicola (strain 342) TaxID=507522 RepID=B5RKM1_KLEV3|nr:hypothetical protein KPK_B0064 [Klebsiella variicola]